MGSPSELVLAAGRPGLARLGAEMPNAVASLSPNEFSAFRKLIHEESGISLGEGKQVLLIGRLSGRLRQLGLGSFGEYFCYLTSGREPDEKQRMLELVTTNETYFFRETAHFDFLREQARCPPAAREFQVWSAAASSGEEAYTMAMVLADELGMDGPWRITASDINRSVLQVAQAAKYRLDTVRGLPPAYLRRYCLKGVGSEAGWFMVEPRLQTHVRFLPVNLKETLPEVGAFDVIFLRNVLIYFDAETKRQVVGKLLQRLRPGGHFVVGHAETLNGIADGVQAVRPTIYRKGV